jgi:hypothetical protein
MISERALVKSVQAWAIPWLMSIRAMRYERTQGFRNHLQTVKRRSNKSIFRQGSGVDQYFRIFNECRLPLRDGQSSSLKKLHSR